MWILVEVEEPQDVGTNEKSRYLVHNCPKIEEALFGNVACQLDATRVHPATSEFDK